MTTAYTWIEEGNWTYRLALYKTSSLSQVPLEPGAFRFHWVVQGLSKVLVNTLPVTAAGPCLLCLGAKDVLQAVDDHAEVRSVVFHPGVLNDTFLEQDVYDLDRFSGTTRSDQYYLHPFLHIPGNPPAPFPLSLTMIDRLQALFDRMEREVGLRQDPFWPCRTRSLMLESLILTRLGAWTPREETFVEQVLVHLHTHYAESFTLSTLASKFATNRTTLAARFREKTGKTIGDYLRAHRIRVAEVLLRDTTLPLHEVLDRVGFADPSHFGRLFRQENRMSPSEYRDKHNWILNPAS